EATKLMIVEEGSSQSHFLLDTLFPVLKSEGQSMNTIAEITSSLMEFLSDLPLGDLSPLVHRTSEMREDDHSLPLSLLLNSLD
ncbi:hypothetical protein ABTN29_20305, partial [Acinetobacter baumannii]